MLVVITHQYDILVFRREKLGEIRSGFTISRYEYLHYFTSYFLSLLSSFATISIRYNNSYTIFAISKTSLSCNSEEIYLSVIFYIIYKLKSICRGIDRL
ncbi:hypothetical protein [Lepagella muris]|uniref:hypothetical protein n=1 Tax=Lepagella muris TaxID=3032870 RepID=UPI003B831A6C